MEVKKVRCVFALPSQFVRLGFRKYTGLVDFDNFSLSLG